MRERVRSDTQLAATHPPRLLRAALSGAGSGGAPAGAPTERNRRRGNKELAKQKRGVFASGAAGCSKTAEVVKKNDGNPLQCPHVRHAIGFVALLPAVARNQLRICQIARLI